MLLLARIWKKVIPKKIRTDGKHCHFYCSYYTVEPIMRGRCSRFGKSMYLKFDGNGHLRRGMCLKLYPNTLNGRRPDA